MNRQRKNVAKLMARLNCKVAQFTIGSGGEPGAGDTPQMIAGALGSVAAKGPGYSLAIAVLCVKWWPAAISKGEVSRAAIRDPKCVHCHSDYDGNPCASGHGVKSLVVVRTPHRPRQDWQSPRMVSGVKLVNRYEYSSARSTIGTAMQESVHDMLKRWLQRKAPKWAVRVPPDLIDRINAKPGFWTSFQAAALSEFCNPQRCIGCGGAGQKLQMIKDKASKVTSKVIVCPVCEGNGTVPKSNNKRAKAIGIRADDFARYVKPLYDQLLNLLRHLEYLAARAVSRSLRD